MNLIAKRAIFLIIAALLSTLTGCESVPRIISEYRIDVQQGNVITREMVEQLKPGLTKDQVRFIMGTPSLVSVFHTERWDYVFYLTKGKTGDIKKNTLSVFFDNQGKLEQYVGDVLPQSQIESVILESNSSLTEITTSENTADVPATNEILNSQDSETATWRQQKNSKNRIRIIDLGSIEEKKTDSVKAESAQKHSSNETEEKKADQLEEVESVTEPPISDTTNTDTTFGNDQ